MPIAGLFELLKVIMNGLDQSNVEPFDTGNVESPEATPIETPLPAPNIMLL